MTTNPRTWRRMPVRWLLTEEQNEIEDRNEEDE